MPELGNGRRSLPEFSIAERGEHLGWVAEVHAEHPSRAEVGHVEIARRIDGEPGRQVEARLAPHAVGEDGDGSPGQGSGRLPAPIDRADGVVEGVSQAVRVAARRLDSPSQALAVAELLTLTFGLIEGNRSGWGSPPIVGLLIGAAALLAGFVTEGAFGANLTARLVGAGVPVVQNRHLAGALAQARSLAVRVQPSSIPIDVSALPNPAASAFTDALHVAYAVAGEGAANPGKGQCAGTAHQCAIDIDC